MSSNPIVNGWYADPEARYYEGAYYIYVTHSLPFKEQLNLDVVYSTDLENWQVGRNILDMSTFPYVTHAVWAPTIIEKNNKYYLVFASNNIQKDEEVGGLEIAVSDSPMGPFKGYLGKSLLDRFVFGAQPIDAHLFKDGDDIYLYFGGWGHCVLAKMNEEMTGFVPLSNGELFMEITPKGYVEGPCMLKRDGKYHFMFSTGNWTDESYGVCTCIAETPEGPFGPVSKILSAQPPVADGPGHHGYLKVEGSEDDWLIVYHRRTVGDRNPHHRMLSIDKMTFSKEGTIEPVKMT
ncbi:MAG: glycoside hydrolase family 43 protein [Clostridia bacterium]|nr:glycoside hydrolase family 43 protein [Clostridia bacterium]